MRLIRRDNINAEWFFNLWDEAGVKRKAFEFAQWNQSFSTTNKKTRASTSKANLTNLDAENDSVSEWW